MAREMRMRKQSQVQRTVLANSDIDVLDRSAITALVGASVPRKTQATKRMSAEDRLNQIIDVAVALIGQRGYNGFSLQDVASAIGISQTAVIHRVKSKQNLLVLVIERYYDMTGAEQDYIERYCNDERYKTEGLRIPEILRSIVEQNARQPQMVRLFQMLNSEAMSPEHPAHMYFVERTKGMWADFLRYKWYVPQGVDALLVYKLANAALYGLEGRWLANPEEVNYIEEWKTYEDYLFPLPMWDGYR